MRQTRFRLNIVFAIIFFTIGVITLLVKEDLHRYFNFIPSALIIFSIVFILTGISFFLMLYVRGYFFNSAMRSEELEYSLRKSSQDEDAIASRFEKFQSEILSKISAYNNPDEIKNEIEQTIQKQVSKLSEENIIKQISQRFDKEILQKEKFQIIADEIYDVKNRIQRETARISRYGYINLMIGFITTFLAIFFLGYSLLSVEYKNTSPMDYLYHFIPRLSLSLLIELFSFFFLRLYKKNLEDIKYFNNERTNIEMKVIAIKASLIYDDKETIKALVVELAKTERNFTLKKDESTVEIEKNKIDSNSNNQLLNGILKILDKK